jgi:hypothetical protein
MASQRRKREFKQTELYNFEGVVSLLFEGTGSECYHQFKTNAQRFQASSPTST